MAHNSQFLLEMQKLQSEENDSLVRKEELTRQLAECEVILKEYKERLVMIKESLRNIESASVHFVERRNKLINHFVGNNPNEMVTRAAAATAATTTTTTTPVAVKIEPVVPPNNLIAPKPFDELKWKGSETVAVDEYCIGTLVNVAGEGKRTMYFRFSVDSKFLTCGQYETFARSQMQKDLREKLNGGLYKCKCDSCTGTAMAVRGSVDDIRKHLAYVYRTKYHCTFCKYTVATFNNFQTISKHLSTHFIRVKQQNTKKRKK